MAEEEFYAGSMGPYTYNTDDVYPSGEHYSGFLGPQARITQPPVDDNHVPNKAYVDDKVNYQKLDWSNPLILIDTSPGIKHIWRIDVSPAGVISAYDLGPAPGQ